MAVELEKVEKKLAEGLSLAPEERQSIVAGARELLDQVRSVSDLDRQKIDPSLAGTLRAVRDTLTELSTAIDRNLAGAEYSKPVEAAVQAAGSLGAAHAAVERLGDDAKVKDHRLAQELGTVPAAIARATRLIEQDLRNSDRIRETVLEARKLEIGDQLTVGGARAFADALERGGSPPSVTAFIDAAQRGIRENVGDPELPQLVDAFVRAAKMIGDLNPNARPALVAGLQSIEGGGSAIHLGTARAFASEPSTSATAAPDPQTDKPTRENAAPPATETRTELPGPSAAGTELARDPKAVLEALTARTAPNEITPEYALQEFGRAFAEVRSPRTTNTIEPHRVADSLEELVRVASWAIGASGWSAGQQTGAARWVVAEIEQHRGVMQRSSLPYGVDESARRTAMGRLNDLRTTITSSYGPGPVERLWRDNVTGWPEYGTS